MSNELKHTKNYYNLINYTGNIIYIKKINKMEKEVEVDRFKYVYEDKRIPYNENGGTPGNFICLGEIIGNEELGLKKGDFQYIDPLVTNVGNCPGCRRIISTNNPSIKL